MTVQIAGAAYDYAVETGFGNTEYYPKVPPSAPKALKGAKIRKYGQGSRASIKVDKAAAKFLAMYFEYESLEVWAQSFDESPLSKVLERTSQQLKKVKFK